jgi:hypothetical protein
MGSFIPHTLHQENYDDHIKEGAMGRASSMNGREQQA